MSDDAREADERESLAAHDSAMIADLRAWRARIGTTESDRWSARFTLGEVDAVLRAIDERDALKRAAVAMPDEGVRREISIVPPPAAPHSWMSCTLPTYEEHVDVCMLPTREIRAACGRTYPHREHPHGVGAECDGIPE